MVFENLTLFEVNLENSRFSASRGGSGSEEDEAFDEEFGAGSESGGRSKVLPLGILLVLVVGGLAFRRYRSGDGELHEMGGADGTEGVSIGQTAEQ